MAHTTIKVEDTVRDRLAVLAAEKGTSIAQLVSDFAAHTPTASERAERTERTLALLREMSGYTPSPERDREADAELARRLGDIA
ncbi:hypothetical protein AB0I66_42680 [Streptomyces sp. NPDC050439]|uniref:hypothetical protein n=1 Tax=unclassified Streptomyces TaxID=2593676 RepID=UPI00343C4272